MEHISKKTLFSGVIKSSLVFDWSLLLYCLQSISTSEALFCADLLKADLLTKHKMSFAHSLLLFKDHFLQRFTEDEFLNLTLWCCSYLVRACTTCICSLYWKILVRFAIKLVISFFRGKLSACRRQITALELCHRNSRGSLSRPLIY